MTQQAGGYLLDGDDEAMRLERQAHFYDLQQESRDLRLEPGALVLDIGCGSGASVRTMAPFLDHGCVVGVDRESRYRNGAGSRITSGRSSDPEGDSTTSFFSAEENS
jgi:cyclopropane fatty-acyl-phospholipid synthase-like methyltransferase